MQFLCVADDTTTICRHRFTIYWGPARNRNGRFLGSIWVCEHCLNRVDKPKKKHNGDLALFDLNGEQHG